MLKKSNVLYTVPEGVTYLGGIVRITVYKLGKIFGQFAIILQVAFVRYIHTPININYYIFMNESKCRICV